MSPMPVEKSVTSKDPDSLHTSLSHACRELGTSVGRAFDIAASLIHNTLSR